MPGPTPISRLIRPLAVPVLLLAFLPASCGKVTSNRVVIGSKNFTEQVVLGELLAQQLEERAGLPVERRFYLNGSFICHQAILAGRIDMYVEYTGTALTAILKEPPQTGAAAVYQRVRQAYAQRFHLSVGPPLGFNNTFALVIRGDDARNLHIKTISDAARFTPGWRAGFGYEFLERADGFAGLQKTYGLRFASKPRVMDLGLLYRALTEKQVDLVAGSSTDGLIAALGLTVLEDDRHYFPPYEATPIVRQETLERNPSLAPVLAGLAGKISEEEMRRLNYALDGEHRDVTQVVREFRRSKGF